MPKIKIDHIVTFSSEDPVHVANNLLSTDPMKKWKCKTPGEKTAVVVLQLEKACEISNIDIGNEHSAYIEILASRSSSPDSDFKMLLVMSSFMTALESRQSQNVNKVRMFSQNELNKPECTEKWDRIKIICTQPFNRHVQYGLSFINLTSNDHSGESRKVNESIGKFALRPESPDNLAIGTIFARRKEQQPLKAAAAIREASSNTSLTKFSCKPQVKQQQPSGSTKIEKERNRDELLYSKDEDEPNEKIDKIIKKKAEEVSKQKDDTPKAKRKIRDESEETPKAKKKVKEEKRRTLEKIVRKPFHQLLNGVVLVISGIQNPDRANLRASSLEMGAKYKSDWDQTCTHLICAFPNTPKFNQVRGKGKIVTKKWLEDCHRLRKRLPWRRYALDRKDQGKLESEEEILEEKPDENDNEMEEASDIEDDIARIQQQNKKNSVFTADTDDEENEPKSNSNGKEFKKKLLDIFKDKHFFVDHNFDQDLYKKLQKYVVAYAGIMDDDPTNNIDVYLTSKDNCDVLKEINEDGICLTPDWVWDCHNKQKLLPIDDYIL